MFDCVDRGYYSPNSAFGNFDDWNSTDYGVSSECSLIGWQVHQDRNDSDNKRCELRLRKLREEEGVEGEAINDERRCSYDNYDNSTNFGSLNDVE
jgi:hypothetical protein